MKIDLVNPLHMVQLLITPMKKLVNDYISHRLETKEIIDAIKKGNNKISDIVKLIYKDVDQSLHPAAAMSTLAHLKEWRAIKKLLFKERG